MPPVLPLCVSLLLYAAAAYVAAHALRVGGQAVSEWTKVSRDVRESVKAARAGRTSRGPERRF